MPVGKAEIEVESKHVDKIGRPMDIALRVRCNQAFTMDNFYRKISNMDYAYESFGPVLEIVALVGLFIFLAVTGGALILVAKLPGKIAQQRGHPQADAINVAGWVGLPTGILWAVALVWAFVRTREVDPSSNDPSSSDTGNRISPQIKKLSQQIQNLEQAVTRLETSH